MNRILKKDNMYLVIVTPEYVSNSSTELMLGAWCNDQHIRGYKILAFRTMENAMEVAFKYPSIDWNKIVNMHVDSYKTITKTVNNVLSSHSYIVEIDSHLMSPDELKNTMFKRVAHYGERFSLFYDANDVISINIVNPWTRNTVEIAKLLKTIPELRIKKTVNTKSHIKLIGLTGVDTTYEIRIWTSLLAQWFRWILNNDLDPNGYINMLPQIYAQQQVVDNGDIVR